MNRCLIQSDPSAMMGKPVVAGTRITVELILERLGAGETIGQLLEAHPRLTREAVLAAMDFARKALHTDAGYLIADLAKWSSWPGRILTGRPSRNIRRLRKGA